MAGWVSFSGTTREPPYDPYAVTTVAPFPQADLTIPQPPSAANPLITGGSIEFDAVINNIGTADAFASFEISFDIDLDSPVFTASDVQLTPNPSLPNLNPGGSQNVTSSAWTAALGIHTLRVCADTSTPGSVTESNETNNCIDWQFEATDGTPTVDIKANGSDYPVTINNGNSVGIYWSTEYAPTSCDGWDGDDNWPGPKSVVGGLYISPPLYGPNTYTYTIQCDSITYGPGLSDSVAVNVNSPPLLPSVDLLADGQLYGYGGSLTVADSSTVALEWNTLNGPTSCAATGNWSGPKDPAGSQGSPEIVGPLAGPGTYTYDITCTNSDGSNSDDVTIVVDSPILPNLPANPDPVDGAANVWVYTDLDWDDSAGAISYDVYFGTNPNLPPPTFLGNTTVSFWDLTPPVLAYDTAYYWKVVAKNAGGDTTGLVWSFTTELPPPPQCTIDAVPDTILEGQFTTLSWSCTSPGGIDRTEITAVPQPDLGEVEDVDNLSIKPAVTTTYTVTAINAGGSGSASVQVTVYRPKIKEVLPK